MVTIRWVMHSHSMLLRARIVKDERPSNKLLHHGPASCLMLQVFPTSVSLLKRQWGFLQTHTCTRFQPWKHSGLCGGTSPLVIKPVRPFLAPDAVSILDELPKLGFLSLGILPVCDLLTGSTA